MISGSWQPATAQSGMSASAIPLDFSTRNIISSLNSDGVECPGVK